MLPNHLNGTTPWGRRAPSYGIAINTQYIQRNISRAIFYKLLQLTAKTRGYPPYIGIEPPGRLGEDKALFHLLGNFHHAMPTLPADPADLLPLAGGRTALAARACALPRWQTTCVHLAGPSLPERRGWRTRHAAHRQRLPEPAPALVTGWQTDRLRRQLIWQRRCVRGTERRGRDGETDP